MKKAVKNNIPCFQFHLLDSFASDIDHAIFTREGGASKAPYESLNVSYNVGDDPKDVDENRRKVLKAMRLDKAVSTIQTHSNRVLAIDYSIVDSNAFTESTPSNEVQNYDGMVTDLAGVGLMVKIADCQAIIFYDPVRKVLGLAHAGWRGLVKDITGNIVEMMTARYGCDRRNIIAAISPSLGPENTFFTDPRKELPETFAPFIINDKRVDLWEFSKQQLIGHGILPEKIEMARICTFGDPGHRFFSHRREKEASGRFAVIACMR